MGAMGQEEMIRSPLTEMGHAESNMKVKRMTYKTIQPHLCPLGRPCKQPLLSDIEIRMALIDLQEEEARLCIKALRMRCRRLGESVRSTMLPKPPHLSVIRNQTEP